MRYRKPNGDEFVLSRSTPAEWSEHIYDLFVRIGCSKDYAEKVAREYRKAVSA